MQRTHLVTSKICILSDRIHDLILDGIQRPQWPQLLTSTVWFDSCFKMTAQKNIVYISEKTLFGSFLVIKTVVSNNFNSNDTSYMPWILRKDSKLASIISKMVKFRLQGSCVYLLSHTYLTDPFVTTSMPVNYKRSNECPWLFSPQFW